jgi:hypothetical protein
VRGQVKFLEDEVICVDVSVKVGETIYDRRAMPGDYDLDSHICVSYKNFIGD